MRAITTPVEREERLNICQQCDKLKIVAEVKVCGACKCPLATKTVLVPSKCPLNKWRIL
jgi:hypothetical protein